MQRIYTALCAVILLLALGACSGGGEQFAAAHILISYQGAMRSTQTRSKEDALALAEQIVTEVAADGSNFGDLARKYSDGPSGPRGGNLGRFRQGMMVAEFQAAVESLEIDEVTRTPVETAFGYHLIQRLEP